jgi:hypothetical protein
MHWIIQHNLFGENAIDELVKILDKVTACYSSYTSYELVKVLPFTDGEVIDAETGLPWKPFTFKYVPTIVIGSETMCRFAKNHNFFPGAFTNEHFNYRSYIEHYENRMLNYMCTFIKIKEYGKIIDIDQEYFVRPVNDGKAFAGNIMTINDIEELVEAYSKYENPFDPDMEIMLCPITKIYDETRCICVDKKIITCSQYKSGGVVHYYSIVDQEVWDFAQECVDIWCPDEVFVIDIARTPDGMKIIELNCFNSAGWYNCDVHKIYTELTRLYE